MHLRKKMDFFLSNLIKEGLWFVGFDMTLGFFLSCRPFSVALNLVGALEHGHWGLH
jgi:hypothetical protein